MSNVTGYTTGPTEFPPIGRAERLVREDEPSEFGLPEGIDVPGYENKAPALGGRYMGKCP